MEWSSQNQTMRLDILYVRNARWTKYDGQNEEQRNIPLWIRMGSENPAPGHAKRGNNAHSVKKKTTTTTRHQKGFVILALSVQKTRVIVDNRKKRIIIKKTPQSQHRAQT